MASFSQDNGTLFRVANRDYSGHPFNVGAIVTLVDRDPDGDARFADTANGAYAPTVGLWYCGTSELVELGSSSPGVVFRIVVDNNSATESPGVPYTAKLFDERGNRATLADHPVPEGIGSSVRQAVEDLLTNEWPELAEDVPPMFAVVGAVEYDAGTDRFRELSDDEKGRL